MYQAANTNEQKFNSACSVKTSGIRNGTRIVCKPYKGSAEKYEQAIEIYRTSSVDLVELARMTGVNLSSFRSYLKRWYPELIVRRRGFQAGTELKDTKRYRISIADKYAAAIVRLKDTEMPISHVASEFGFNPETFRMYVREHFPELATVKGKVKGTNGKTVLFRSASKYSEALYLYETTTESLKSISTRLGLVYNSVGGYIRRNHPEAIERHNYLLETTERPLGGVGENRI